MRHEINEKYSGVLVFLILIFMSYYIYYKKSPVVVEGNIGDAINEIRKVGKIASDIPNKIDNLGESILDKTEKIVTDKIGGIFQQIGNVLKEAIVDPIMILFKSVGNAAMGVFKILKKIGFKIGSLPFCVFFYLLFSIEQLILAMMPGFVKNIYKKLKSLLGYVLDAFNKLLNLISLGPLKLPGSHCFEFNISDEIDWISKRFQYDMDKFKNSFGDIKFKI